MDGTSPVTFPEESSWSKYGRLGVELFFLISGFVVLMSVLGVMRRRGRPWNGRSRPRSSGCSRPAPP